MRMLLSFGGEETDQYIIIDSTVSVNENYVIDNYSYILFSLVLS